MCDMQRAVGETAQFPARVDQPQPTLQQLPTAGPQGGEPCVLGQADTTPGAALNYADGEPPPWAAALPAVADCSFDVDQVCDGAAAGAAAVAAAAAGGGNLVDDGSSAGAWRTAGAADLLRPAADPSLAAQGQRGASAGRVGGTGGGDRNQAEKQAGTACPPCAGAGEPSPLRPLVAPNIRLVEATGDATQVYLRPRRLEGYDGAELAPSDFGGPPLARALLKWRFKLRAVPGQRLRCGLAKWVVVRRVAPLCGVTVAGHELREVSLEEYLVLSFRFTRELLPPLIRHEAHVAIIVTSAAPPPAQADSGPRSRPCPPQHVTYTLSAADVDRVATERHG